MPKVVLVATSAPELKGHPTGVWMEELSSPYYAFKEKGYDVVIASPKGGPIPIDQNSLGEGFFVDSAKKFLHDMEAVGALSHSVELSTIDFTSGSIDAIYMTGGHGTCTDFADNPVLKSAIETMYAANKIVAAVCHGPMCLPQCCKPDGTPLVQGLKVTGFTDSEEAAVQLTELVPFLLESKLKEQGAIYEAEPDWHPSVCVDGKLVTGQNPQSSDKGAEAVIKLLES
eukprot:CAMPEP_0172494712 /NCGR_PEP_ID=MMETSP1066-20121228/54424_1 /TAXON_ID=671091 /ORGANISM="Coscinodiscus wailesii, Strain CCMP2513" /LENGTH=227 /DNA_ID=CAMNT_0013265901 /DNA_START=36 /DNA_END=719 /DNA_ORIENTATION=-